MVATRCRAHHHASTHRASAPDLFAITERIPDRTKLRARIWDMSEANPNTVMPPYGKHRILIEAEIDAVVHYLEKS